MSNTSTQIPFGIIFRGQPEYTYREVDQFIDCSDNIHPLTFRAKYVQFLRDFLSGEIKPSTLVDWNILCKFYGDLDARADIDYRTDNWEEEPEIVAGGKFFDGRAKKLREHLLKHGITVSSLSDNRVL